MEPKRAKLQAELESLDDAEAHPWCELAEKILGLNRREVQILAAGIAMGAKVSVKSVLDLLPDAP